MSTARTLLLLFVGLLAGLTISFAVVLNVTNDPPFGIGIAIGVLLGLLLFGLIRSATVAFQVALSAARNRRTARAMLDQRLRSRWQMGIDVLGTAALQASTGDLEGARKRIQVQRTTALGVQTIRCILAQLALEGADRTADAAALQQLLALGNQSFFGIEHYRAWLLARAAIQLNDPQSANLVLAEIGNSRDVEVQSVSFWVRAWFELPLATGVESAAVGHRALSLADAGEASPLMARIQQRIAALTQTATGLAYR